MFSFLFRFCGNKKVRLLKDQIKSRDELIKSQEDLLESKKGLIASQREYIACLEKGKAMTAQTFLTKLKDVLRECTNSDCSECKHAKLCEDITFFTQMLESDIFDLFTLLERMEANVSSTAVHDVS